MAPYRGRIERQGPFVEVKLIATHQRVMALRTAGLPPPQPKTVRALVDTGASCCAVDSLILQSMGLAATGSVAVHTPSTGDRHETRDLYDVSLALRLDPVPVRVFTCGVVAADLAGEGFLALIGWDVLRACVLRCDGPSGTFELDYGGASAI